MKKKLFICAVLCCLCNTIFAFQTISYELVPANGKNSSYAGNCDVEINGITWNLTGNSQTIPWRIGGKSLSEVTERRLYSKNPINQSITKITVTHGAASGITVHSFKMIVSTEENGGGTKTEYTKEFVVNESVVFAIPEGVDWTNKYYTFVYNVTVSTTSSNRFIEFKGAEFYTGTPSYLAQPTFTPEANKVAEDGTFTEPFTVSIAGEDGTTIKYTLDGTDPTTSTTTQTYTKPITISKSTKVNAIATDGTEISDKATAIYVLLNSEQTAYTATECIELIDNNIGLNFEYYAKGTIKSIDEFNNKFGSLTYYITDGTNDLQVYSGLNINGEKFTGTGDLQVGGQVVVKGVLKKHNNTYEFDKNNVIISYQAPDKTSVENTSIIAPKTTKVLENGQIIILTPEGKKYNIGGQAIQ